MSLNEQIQDHLQRDEVEERWKDIINGVIDDESAGDRLMNWITDHRDKLVDLAEVVEDEHDVREALITYYIESKCDWMNLNTHMQYKMVNTGEQDNDLMVRGSLMSHLLEEMEELLDPEEVESLTQFLAKPMDELANQNTSE